MGDYVLMKKLLLIAAFFILPMTLVANDTPESHAKINKQIEEIKPSRTGVRTVDVQRTKSPFLMFKTTKKGKRVVYTAKKRVKLAPLKLESVINKNIKINGKWYKEGDRVRQYVILKVSSDYILLKSKKKQLKLFQNSKNDKIRFNVN